METQAAPTGREEWQKRVERWRDSGLSAEQFAADLGINAGTLKYWKYRLGKEAAGRVAAEAKPTFIKGLRAGSLVEVQGVTIAAPAAFVLELGRDRRLQIPPQFDAAVLSSHSRERPEVCPQAPAAPGRFKPELAAGDQLSLEGLFAVGQETKELHSGRSRFRWLLKRVFRAGLETCSQCGGAMRWVEVAAQRGAITRLLAKHGLGPQPPPTQRTDLSWAQLTLPFRRREGLGAGSGPGHTEPARTCVREQVKRSPRPGLLLKIFKISTKSYPPRRSIGQLCRLASARLPPRPRGLSGIAPICSSLGLCARADDVAPARFSRSPGGMVVSRGAESPVRLAAEAPGASWSPCQRLSRALVALPVGRAELRLNGQPVIAYPAMRVALISDLHGNALALETVLRDIACVGVDRTVCLGDTATLGPAPLEVLSMLRELAIPCIEGNHDAFLLDPELLRAYTEAPRIVAAVDWCRSELPTWALDFVRGFLPSLELELGASASLKLFHGTPRSHMEDLLATTPPDQVEEMLNGLQGTVMAGGHTHVQMLRQHRGTLIVNAGSVGAPFKEFVDHKPPTILAHAEYATVEASSGGIQVTLRRVDVDRRALWSAASASSNPLGPMLAQNYV